MACALSNASSQQELLLIAHVCGMGILCISWSSIQLQTDCCKQIIDIVKRLQLTPVICSSSKLHWDLTAASGPEVASRNIA